MNLVLEPFDPCPIAKESMPEGETSSKALSALDFETKYQFVNAERKIIHEYPIYQSDLEQACGAYVGKVIMYRDPALREHFEKNGITLESFLSPSFPILSTRSPRKDLYIFWLIRHLQKTRNVKRVKLFELGCSVGEHYDLLDTLLKVDSQGRENAYDALAYYGLDFSPLLLFVAKLLHDYVDPAHFKLNLSEGSAFIPKPDEFDISLSVGVINQTPDPVRVLGDMIKGTRYACVVSAWTTTKPEGRWVINHGGRTFYFYSREELLRLQETKPGWKWLVLDYIPDLVSDQPRSYVGVGEDELSGMGSYLLIGTCLDDLPFTLEPLRI